MKSLHAILSKLETYLTTSTLVPPDYSESIKRFARHDVTPLATLKCSSVVDAQTAVKFCNDNAIDFVVKSGGKNQANTSIRQNALVLDLSPLKKISHQLKDNKMLLKIEAGVNFGELQEYLYSFNSKNNAGFNVPLAWARGISCIGAHTIMGNGLTHRKCGLGVDLIIQAKVLLSNGQIVIANEENNADLLWGVKGCGPLLGIILQIIEQVPECCDFVDPQAGAQIRVRSYSFPINDSLNIGKSITNLINSTEDTALPYTFISVNKKNSAIYLMVYQMLYSKDLNKILQQNNENIDKIIKQMAQKYNGKSYFQNGYTYDIMTNTIVKEKQPGKKYYYIWGGYTDISSLPEILHKISTYYSSNPFSSFKSDDVSIGTNIVPIKSKAFLMRDASKASIPISKSEQIIVYGNINFSDKDSHEQCYNYIKKLELSLKDLMKVGSICDFNKKDTADPETCKWIFGNNYQRIKQIHQKYDPLNKFGQGLF